MSGSDVLGVPGERPPFIIEKHDDGSVTLDLAAHPRSAEVPARFRKVVTVPATLLETARSWAAAPGSCLYLMGGTGPGKTQLAWALVLCCLDGARQGAKLAAYPVPELFEELRRSYDAPQSGFYAPEDPVKRCSTAALLLLDDFGAEKVTDWTRERMLEIIDHRYSHMLPLIVTSNLDPAALAETQEDRLVSRLAEMTGHGKFTVHVTGPDRRRGGAA